MTRLLVALFLAIPIAAEDLRQSVARIESAVLDPSRSVAVQDVVLRVGPATITLHRGTVVPSSATIDGSAAEVVFVGEGRIVLDPPDAIEASQLELFTGKSNLDQELKAAVLVTADDAMAAALLKGTPVPPTDATATLAAATFNKWQSGTYRRRLRIAPNLFADSVGERAAQAFFGGLFTSTDLGDFVYVLHPDSDEEVALGQFIADDLTDREKRRAARELAREQRRGRSIGTRVDDLGTWNTWLSTSLGEDKSAGDAFEPEHYVLDATIEGGTLRLVAKARVRLSVVSGGKRIVPLTLHPDLQVQRVTDVSGAELFHQRWDDAVNIVLATAPATGAKLELNVEYSGVAVEKGGQRTFAVRDPTHWYPQTGARDRATYETTFRWPRKLELLAAGRRVDGGVGPDRGNWAKYRIDVPTGEFGFEIGRFEIERFQVGHIGVTLGFDASGNRLEDDIRKEMREGVEQSLRYLEEKLGAHPLNELTVVTVPRGYSQSLLGFITLSTVMMQDYGMWAALIRAPDRRAVIAHEVAHQWWGGVVGWRNYRARWISEAMAQYSAMRFAREKLTFEDRVRVVPTVGWREVLTQTTPDGRTVESVGPLVLGDRLSSTRAPEAYRAIVYDKGGLVMLMLGRAIGERRFDQALRAVVERAAATLISTDEFVEMLSDASGLEVAPFARQWIYGTGMPTITYSHEIVKTASGRWTVKGKARQRYEPRFHYRVGKDDRGKLMVQRERTDEVEASRVPMFVPVRIEVLNPEDEAAKKSKEEEGSGYVVQSIVVRGEETPFELDVQWEPKRLKLDPDGEVLARFRNEKRNPRRVLFAEAVDLAADGAWADAEQRYRAALAAEPPMELESDSSLTTTAKQALLEIDRAYLEAQIHLGLARVLLQTPRYEHAKAALDDARKSLGRSRRQFFESELATLEAHFEIRRGESEKAFRRLRKLTADHDRYASAEAFLLMAIAARDSGHRAEFEKARERARRSGIDVSMLR